MKQELFPEESAIVLDTNVVSHSKRKSFSNGMKEWLKKSKACGNALIIPQIAVYEYLRNVKDYREFQELHAELKGVGVGECRPEVLQCALFLNILYHQIEETKEFAQKDTILNDLLVGAIAGKHQVQTGIPTYVASCDYGFLLPYFSPFSYFPIPHNQRPEKTAILYLYEVNVKLANEQWKKFTNMNS
jgi:predicted nucleic acid-binding protein